MVNLPILVAITLLPAAAPAATAEIPAWARKYNVNCSACHYPAPPRLNEAGIRFRWAGYRLPEDIGEDTEAARVSNYLASRASFQYVYAKPSGEAATVSRFDLADANLYYAGPYGRNFGGFFEVAKEEDEVEFSATLVALWGGERTHGGVRVGRSHLIYGAGVAGFDRPAGISSPGPAVEPVTAAIPFALGGDQAGLEAFYVLGRNRVSLQMFDGLAPEAVGTGEAGGSRKKDFVLTNQLVLDSLGSGLYATGYYGTVAGIDPAAPALDSHFWRLALSASKILSRFELLGGLVYGKDLDLPLGTPAAFPASNLTGYGYWFSGQYVLVRPSALTLIGRYEFTDPDTDAEGNGFRRFVVGGILPINVPEYLRLALEYRLDDPAGSAGPSQHNVAAEAMLSF